LSQESAACGPSPTRQVVPPAFPDRSASSGKHLAPRDGDRTQSDARQMVGSDTGQRLFLIADLATLWVTADIYEKDLALIRL